MIIQKQRAKKTAFYASDNLSANLQLQTGTPFCSQVVNLHCILGYWPWESVTQWRQLLENLSGAFAGQVKLFLYHALYLSHCCMRCVKRNFHWC